jgi:signal transduction histidine kinase
MNLHQIDSFFLAMSSAWEFSTEADEIPRNLARTIEGTFPDLVQEVKILLNSVTDCPSAKTESYLPVAKHERFARFTLGKYFLDVRFTVGVSENISDEVCLVVQRGLEYSSMAYSVGKNQSKLCARQNFFTAITAAAPSHPDVDLLNVCKAWQSGTGADKVWLLVKNPYADTQPWEIIAQIPENSTLKKVTFEGQNVADYCLAIKRCLSVKEFKNFKINYLQVTYDVPWANELESLGCTRFECIPLLKPVLPPHPGRAHVCPLPEGAILLLYNSGDLPPTQPKEELLLMGSVTEFMIFGSYQAEQRRILVSLNMLAEKALTKVRANPVKIHREYLTEVIHLIKEAINVKAVSIFYRDITGNKVECIATTGLCNNLMERIPPEDISAAYYMAGEKLTGQCFKEGKPIILTEQRFENHSPKFLEMPYESKTPLRTLPAIFQPIPTQIDGDILAAGVIRCALHISPALGGQNRRFDALEVQTLGFIASQLGPVLHTMENNIRREQTISITKHDLRAPLQMIESTFERLEPDLPKDSKFVYHLKDIRCSLDVAKNLVAQLEPDPAEVKDFSPVTTFLEGDIIAGLKSMLGHYAWEMRKTKIKFGSFADVPPVKVDRALIARALSNLIVNAIKYGERGSEISILATRAQDGFHVHVVNYGIGVASEDAPQIFKANFRSERTRSLALGSGLGLTIAKAAIEKHGGRLELTKPKDPTIFSLFFPRQLFAD